MNLNMFKRKKATVPGEGSGFSTANNEFTVDLYNEFFPDTCGANLIFSPFSLHTVLGMVGMGAAGNTRTEILKGLRIPEQDNNKKIGASYDGVFSHFQGSCNPNTFTLLTANRIYSQAGFGLNQILVNDLRKYFLADLRTVDFSSPLKCKMAANEINKWVESITNHKIKNLINPQSLNGLTRLILVNAIYFKGHWEYAFDDRATRKDEFRLSSGETVEADMMFMAKKLPYGKLPKLDAEALALPYKGGRLSMVIILPKEVGGLPMINNSIGKVLQGGKCLIGERLSDTVTIQLMLPKFRIEAEIGNLMGALKNLGMKSMFTGEANFDYMTEKPGNGLYVSQIVHKAFIEVNEKGAEAAAATAVVMAKKCGGPRPKEEKIIPFLVNRPFYFQIVDRANGDLVLFAGHCNDPTCTEK